jgi:hypothetical protein
MTKWEPSFASCDDYMNERTGKYEYRAIRYRKAADWLILNGLTDQSTVCDIGAGWTEFDYCLRTEYDWKGRYIPIDGGISSIDLNDWVPERSVEFYVGLEILEHLYNPMRLVRELQRTASGGIAVSVPDPDNVDVFGLDDTHVIEVTRSMLEGENFTVTSEQLYGGVFSDGRNDALMGFWTPNT